MQRVAGAKAIPCARRADGAPQQARTSPGKAGKVRADAPATRGGRGTAQLKRQFSRYRKKGSTGVQGV